MYDQALSAAAPSLADLSDEIDRACEQASAMPVASRPQAIATLLRAADALTAAAVDLVGRGGIESVTGLATETVLALDGRRIGSEARTITQAAGMLRQMPHLAACFARGIVSWGQVRCIMSAVSRLRAADRTDIDTGIGDRAPRMTTADPELLLEWVDAQALRRRPDLALRREDRALKANFLSIQPRLDGRASLYGEGDAASVATVAEALDAVADAPVHPDEGISRAQQRFDALVAISEQSLNGRPAGAAEQPRPRPRLYATFDLAGLADRARDDGIRLLWSLAGRNPRLTHVARDTLLCDATIIPVVFDGPHPIEVGDAANTFSDKVRAAIVARDRRCRFCNRAPASWCDVHHIIPGFGRSASDGVLLCRRCHRRVHRYGWKTRLLDSGIIEFTRRGYTFESLPP